MSSQLNEPAPELLVFFSYKGELCVRRRVGQVDGPSYRSFNDILEEENASFRVVLALDDQSDFLEGLDIVADSVVIMDVE